MKFTKDTYIEVTEDTSPIVQNILFSLGYTWLTARSTVQYIQKKYICLTQEDKYITWSNTQYCSGNIISYEKFIKLYAKSLNPTCEKLQTEEQYCDFPLSKIKVYASNKGMCKILHLLKEKRGIDTSTISVRPRKKYLYIGEKSVSLDTRHEVFSLHCFKDIGVLKLISMLEALPNYVKKPKKVHKVPKNIKVSVTPELNKKIQELLFKVSDVTWASGAKSVMFLCDAKYLYINDNTLAYGTSYSSFCENSLKEYDAEKLIRKLKKVLKQQQKGEC